MGANIRRCPYCGVEIFGAPRNCHTCGRLLTEPTPAPAQPPPPTGPPLPGPYGAPPPWATPQPGAPWYPQPQQYEYVYGQQYAYPQATRSTNGMAIASLVLGIVGALGCTWFIPSILALVFGYIARRQIRESGGAQAGLGFTTAGIILGWLGVVIGLVFFVFVFSGPFWMDTDPPR